MQVVIVTLLPVAFCIWLGLVLTVVPFGIFCIGMYKRCTIQHQTLPAWAALPEGAEKPPSTVIHIELWLSRQLNKVPWHKVAVLFTVERDGVIAIHTHGARPCFEATRRFSLRPFSSLLWVPLWVPLGCCAWLPAAGD